MSTASHNRRVPGDPEQRFAILVVLLIGAVRFINLGFKDLQAWDEALYAMRAEVILRFGAWVDQTRWAIDGLYSSLPPPIAIWSTALSFLVFGVNEFAARFASALFGVLTLFVIYRLGVLLRSKEVGLLAVLVFGLNPFVTFYARQGQLDTPLTFFLTLGGYFVISALGSYEMRRAILAGVSIGAALMTKLYAGVGIPVAMVFLLAFIPKPERPRALRFFWIALSVALIAALPWHIYMTIVHGHGDLFFFFNQSQLINRSISGIEGNVKSLEILYFVNQLLVLFPVGIVWFVYGLITVIKAREPGSVFLCLWFAVFFIVFSFIRTKLAVYALPMLAPASIVASMIMEDAFHGRIARKTFIFLLTSTGIAILWSSSQLWRNLFKELLLTLGGLQLPDGRLMVGLIPFFGIALLVVIVMLALQQDHIHDLFRRYFRHALVVVTAFPTFYHIAVTDRIAYRDGASELAAIISARSYSTLVVAGYERNPQLTYYLEGVDIGWRNNLNMRRIIPPSDSALYHSWLTQELSSELPGTLVIIEKDKFIRYSYINPSSFIPSNLRGVFRSRRYDAFVVVAYPDLVNDSRAAEPPGPNRGTERRTRNVGTKERDVPEIGDSRSRRGLALIDPLPNHSYHVASTIRHSDDALGWPFWGTCSFLEINEVAKLWKQMWA